MKLLDTTFLVDVLRRQEAARRFALRMEEAGERAATTEVNAFELLLGAHHRGRRQERRMADVTKLLDRLEVLPLERAGATRAAEILSRLRASGDDLGLLDALVAGIALASGHDTIVTRDEGFRRVASLRIQAY